MTNLIFAYRSINCDNLSRLSYFHLFLFSYLFQDHLELQNSTLHLAVNLLDKFLSTQTLSVSKLQLVGVTCLFIAAKYLERFPPQVSEL